MKNLPTNYVGARGSNSGDEFHILWTLINCLSLLNPATNLKAISIEDPAPEDIVASKDADLLLGIDCGFYYGGENFQESEKVLFSQLKYSPSAPKKEWTIARLTYSKGKKNSSVIKRLADVFLNYNTKQSKAEWMIALVTNQPLSVDVYNVIKDCGGKVPLDNYAPIDSKAFKSAYDKLCKSSGLAEDVFEQFIKKLDFSNCGTLSSITIEESVIRQLASWLETDAKSQFKQLFHYVFKLTLPEAAGHYVTKESFITWLGLSSEAALFPAPVEIKNVENLVSRKGVNDVINSIRSKPITCLHGQGGFGKTTLLQEIAPSLPTDSKLIIYDCYGGGTYLNSDKTRHRAQEAFTQLANTLAVNTGTASFLIPSKNTNYPKAFAKKLLEASQALFLTNKDALLLIAIDAADNSIIAAEKSNDKECFITDLLTLSSLPHNVRLLLTCRTGRIDSLQLPNEVNKLELPAFNEQETKSYLGNYFSDLSQEIIQDFHHLSRGIPRVQAYAIKYADGDLDKLLNLLRPNGKNLDEIFLLQLQEATLKAGNTNIQEMITVLVELPRPIPVTHLAKITNLSGAAILDICADLAPGVKFIQDQIDFADEDFEAFISQQADESGLKDDVRSRIANHLFAHRNLDSYAAFHIADALVKVNRMADLLSIIDNELEPEIITDVLIKRQVITRRLSLGLLCAEETENQVEAFKILLSAAPALKTEQAFYQLLIDKPQLAVAFADEAVEKSILQNKEFDYGHGPIRFHKALYEARNNQAPLARQSLRWAYEWIMTLQKRDSQNEEKWKYSVEDAAAGIETSLHLLGIQKAYKDFRRWRSKSYRDQIGLVIVENLCTKGNYDQIAEILGLDSIKPRDRIALIVPLLLVGRKIKRAIIIDSLKELSKLPKWNLSRLTHSGHQRFEDKIFELALAFLELCYANKRDKNLILKALDKIVPREERRADKIYTSSPASMDIRIRAAVLQSVLDKKAQTAEKILFANIKDPDEKGITTEERKNRLKKKEVNEEGQRATSLLLPIYQKRINLLADKLERKQVLQFINDQITRIKNESWRFKDYWFLAALTKVAESLSILNSYNDIDRKDFTSKLMQFVNWQDTDGLGSRRFKILETVRHIPELHDLISETINKAISLDIKKTPASAKEKSDAYVKCAELLLDSNTDDARHYFETAIEITKQVDEDAFDQIKLLEKLSYQVKNTKFSDKRPYAHQISQFIADVSIKLSGWDHFPWDEGIKAIAYLDPSIALAAISRWNDRELISYQQTLKSYLISTLENNIHSPQIVASLSMLLSEAGSEIAKNIAKKSLETYSINQHRKLGLKLAANILFYTRPNHRLNYGADLIEFYKDGPLIDQLETLNETVNFLKSIEKPQSEYIPAELKFDFSDKDYTNSSTILDTIQAIREAQFYDQSVVFANIRKQISIGNRVSFLNVLLQLSDEISLKTILPETLDDWSDSPSIKQWASSKLPTYIIDNLPYLSTYIRYNPLELRRLLNATCLESSGIIKLLLKGIRKNPTSFDSFCIYGLLGVVSKYLNETDAKLCLEFFVDKLKQLIDYEDDKDLNLSRIPQDVNSSIGRFLYSLLGDVDKQIRWKAAYTLRCIAYYRETKVLSYVIRNYSITQESEFRAHELPFYSMAAKQWLLIALERISQEDFEILFPYLETLNDIALDGLFPHVIIQHFAQKTVLNILNKKPGCLDADSERRIRLVNLSPFPKIKRDSYNRIRLNNDKNPRFHFDSTDTIPYWYSPAASCFIPPKEFDFLKSAESWICDKWGVKIDAGKWLEEPRKNFNTMDYKFCDHRHGSIPRVERLSVYLEFNAMMCVLGEMLIKFPLVENDYDRWDDWLNSHSLPRNYWLSDIKMPVPQETHFWLEQPEKLTDWVCNVSAQDLDRELGLIASVCPDNLIVQSYCEIKGRLGYQTSFVRTGLVNPDVSIYLLRALQTAHSYHDYKIPHENEEEMEIDDELYTLKGWLKDFENKYGIDDNDLYKNEIRTIQCSPGRNISKFYDLESTNETAVEWYSKKLKSTVFKYETWSDTSKNDRYIHDTFSDGYRLWIKKSRLLDFLKSENMDLIVEVNIQRHESYENSRWDKDNSIKEGTYDRIYVITREGSVLTLAGNSQFGERIGSAIGDEKKQ